MRHVKPDMPKQPKVDGIGFKQWIDLYNSVGLSLDSVPNTELINRCKQCVSIVCSNLRRSTDSAKILGFDKPLMIDEKFPEHLAQFYLLVMVI